LQDVGVELPQECRSTNCQTKLKYKILNLNLYSFSVLLINDRQISRKLDTE